MTWTVAHSSTHGILRTSLSSVRRPSPRGPTFTAQMRISSNLPKVSGCLGLGGNSVPRHVPCWDAVLDKVGVVAIRDPAAWHGRSLADAARHATGFGVCTRRFRTGPCLTLFSQSEQRLHHLTGTRSLLAASPPVPSSVIPTQRRRWKRRTGLMSAAQNAARWRMPPSPRCERNRATVVVVSRMSTSLPFAGECEKRLCGIPAKPLAALRSSSPGRTHSSDVLQICRAYDVPYVSLRALSDLISGDAAADFNDFCERVRPKPSPVNRQQLGLRTFLAHRLALRLMASLPTLASGC
eukprot:scaffold298237_cov28-Tisochrysis_lutea.AAC.1